MLQSPPSESPQSTIKDRTYFKFFPMIAHCDGGATTTTGKNTSPESAPTSSSSLSLSSFTLSLPSSSSSSPVINPISCYDVFEKFCACSVSTKQFEHLRREGVFQNCNELLSDVSICLQSKVMRDPVQQQAKYNEMKVLKNIQHVNNAWEYKKTPSWSPEE